MFVSVGAETNRLEKTRFISKNEVVRKYLNVCANGSFDNCSRCFKCKRTMLDLYLVGDLENFKKCFDVDLFIKHKNYFLQYAYSFRNDIDMMEIYIELKKRKEFTFRHFIVDKLIKFKRVFKKK